MRIVTFLILLVLLIISYMRWRNFLNLSVIFISYWTVIVFFTGIRLYGLYAVSNQVYIIVLVSCLAFWLGSYITDKRKIKKRFSINGKIEYVYDRKAKYLFILAIFVVGIQVAYMIPAILEKGMAYARYQNLGNVMVSFRTLGTIIGYFGLPFLRAITIVILIKMTMSTIYGNEVLMLIISVVIVVLSQGGRTNLMQFLISGAYLIIMNRKRLKTKAKMIIKISAVTSIGGMLWITLERGGKIWKDLYHYYSGALVYFTKTFDKDVFAGEPFYGFNSFQGFFRPIFGVTKVLGLQDPMIMTNADNFILRLQHLILAVSPNKSMNFFVTCFGYMYRDGGYIAVVIISFFFGVICILLEQKCRYDNNKLRWLAIKILFLQGICFTMINFPLADYNTTMAMIYIFVITTNKRPKIVLMKQKNNKYQ